MLALAATPRRATLRLAAAAVAGSACLVTSPSAQSGRIARAVALHADARDADGLRSADVVVLSLLREGRLARTARIADTLVPGAEHVRLQQMHRGLPVWASTVTVQERGGIPISVYGSVFEGLDEVNVDPVLSADDARVMAGGHLGVELGPALPARLHVFVGGDAAPRLAYAVRATAPTLLTYLLFVDAHTGAVIEQRLDTRLQAAVGVGRGVLGENRKVSASALGGRFVLADLLRPQQLQTYDMRGDVDGVLAVLNGTRLLSAADLGSDADNTWTDPALVDAHVYSGWAYDYLVKRFDRLGLDGVTPPVVSIVHPARREDVALHGARVPQFFAGAGYFGGGISIFGDGLPAGSILPATGQGFDFLSGGLDIVGHEIAHGLTEHLEYVDEPGALTEVFSDVIGTSLEFFFQAAGGGRGTSDYQIGEDVVTFGAIRSMSNPTAFGSPDQYRNRYLGADDNGGVHTNAGIGNLAFYLAIEGGQHPSTGARVTGVGAANRVQIERIFYRAFTLMLPARATYSVARAATMQAARDLYGAGSAAETAIVQAWTAVGVP